MNYHITLRDADYNYRCLQSDFVGQMKKICKDKKKSQEDLAKELGKARSFITSAFASKQNLTMKSIAQLASGVGYTPHLVLVSNDAEHALSSYERAQKRIFENALHELDHEHSCYQWYLCKGL